MIPVQNGSTNAEAKHLHEMMRAIAPGILGDAQGGKFDHGVFVEPSEISTPQISAAEVFGIENGLESLSTFLIAFKLAIRAMGANGCVSWVASIKAKDPVGKFTFFPAT